MNLGEPITVMENGMLLHARVSEIPKEGFTRVVRPVRYGMGGAMTLDTAIAVDDEGVTWCRGHVHEDSLEGKALLAAAALNESNRNAPSIDDLLKNPRITFRDVLGGRRR